MHWTIAGLGNPGEAYVGSRHNVGRDMLAAIAKKGGVDSWRADKKLRAQLAQGKLFGAKIVLVLPDAYMNNSGAAFKSLIATKKGAEKLIVVHDELDLPLGAVKLSFGSGSGGHRGVYSVERVLKTRDFIRVRIGISPATAAGKLRKPEREKVVAFVLGQFTPAQREKLKKVRGTVAQALELIVTEGLGKAMTVINAAK